MRRIVAAALVVMCVGDVGARQQAATIPIYVQHSGDDRVGTDFAYQVREQLRRSAGYPLILKEADAAIVVSLVSLDQNCGRADLASVVAIAFYVNVANRPLLNHSVMLVGKEKTDSMAKTLVASLDHAVEQFRNGK